MKKSFYEYTGDTECGEGYVNGGDYALEIMSRSVFQRAIGMFYGVPFSWKIVVMSPIEYPYCSWGAFDSDWKYKFMRFS